MAEQRDYKPLYERVGEGLNAISGIDVVGKPKPKKVEAFDQINSKTDYTITIKKQTVSIERGKRWGIFPRSPEQVEEPVKSLDDIREELNDIRGIPGGSLEGTTIFFSEDLPEEPGVEDRVYVSVHPEIMR